MGKKKGKKKRKKRRKKPLPTSRQPKNVPPINNSEKIKQNLMKNQKGSPMSQNNYY